MRGLAVSGWKLNDDSLELWRRTVAELSDSITRFPEGTALSLIVSDGREERMYQLPDRASVFRLRDGVWCVRDVLHDTKAGQLSIAPSGAVRMRMYSTARWGSGSRTPVLT